MVTANRREQVLHDVPLAVTALSGKLLTEKGISNLGEVQAGTVPGVIVQQFGGTGSVVGISVRGVSSGDVSQVTQELPVPVYIDGVYIGRAQGLGLDLITPERVEFLRGPQGTLFGRNAEGGVVQYVTQKPTGVGSADVTATVGNYDFRRVRGMFNLPAFNNISIQLAGVYSDRAGFVKNRPVDALPTGPTPTSDGEVRQQRDFNARETYGARAAVRWQPTDALTVDYAFDWGRINETQAYLTYTGPAVGGASAPMTDLPDSSDRALYNGLYRSRVLGHALTVDWKASDTVTLKSITAYRESSREGYGSTGSAFNIGPNFRLPAIAADAIFANPHEDNTQNQWSQEFQFLGNWNRLQLTAGAVYYIERVTASQRGLFISGPGNALLGLPEFEPGVRTNQHSRTDSLGLYSQATWTPPVLNEKLELTAGIRFSSDRKNAVRTQGSGNGLATIAVPLNKHARFSEDRVDPAFTIKYNFSDDANVYVRYAQAYRAGGVSVRSINFDPYGSEVNKAWELGMKLRSKDRRFNLNADIYHTKIIGFQINTVESDTLITSTSTVNIPASENVYGAEIEMLYHPTQPLSLGLNYAYTHGSLPLFDNPSTKLVVEQLSLRVLNVPKHTLSATVDYRVPVGSAALVLHADYSHATRYFTTSGVTNGFVSPKAPSIVRQLNARATLTDFKIDGVQSEVAFWVKNLLDRHDVVYGFGTASDRVHSYNYLSDPRTFGLDFRLRL